MELADAPDSKSGDGNIVWVRLPPSAPLPEYRLIGMMKKLVKILLILSLYIISTTVLANPNSIITDYHQTFIPCYDKDNALRIAIRMYYLGNTPYFLVVNPYSFSTEIAPANHFSHRKKMSGEKKNQVNYFTMREIQDTPYVKALLRYTSAPYPSENDGITAADHFTQGIFLTIDMCPSIKPFEKEFFQTLVLKSEHDHQAIPVAISVSGVWMINHQQELKWLIQQVQEKKLEITWINHSFSHIYYRDLPMEKDFLLSPWTNVPKEILEAEKILLQANQTPSVFFRFPGLISDKTLVLTLREFGLIPVGSNAWLAKGQPAKLGSIVLIHGNSNEHQGIEKMMLLLKQSDFSFLPLTKAF